MKYKLSILIAVVFLFYWQVAFFKWEQRGQNNKIGSYYNWMASSMLRGRIDMGVKLPDDFFKNPYDFKANSQTISDLKIFDLSFYNGKLYSYFGVVPALVLYLPFQALTGLFLWDRAAALLFCFGGFLFSIALIQSLIHRHSLNVSDGNRLFAFAILGFCSAAPVLLFDATVYEIAGVAGYFFLMGALFFLSLALREGQLNERYLLGAGLFFGLAAGCRPHYFLVGGFALIVTGWKLFRERKLTPKILTFSIAPFFLCLFFLGLYNYVRFDHFFEFGTRYQLSFINHRLGQDLFSAANIIPNIYLYLFHPPAWNEPFLSPAPFPIWLTRWIETAPYGIEKITGIFTVLPYTWLIFIGFIGAWFKIIKKIYWEEVLFLGSFFILLIFLSSFRYVSLRYLADLTPLLLLLSTWIWFKLDFLRLSLLGQKGRFCLRAFVYVSGGVSILIPVFYFFAVSYRL